MARASNESYRKFLQFFAIMVVVSIMGSFVGLHLYQRTHRNSSTDPLCAQCVCNCSSRFPCPQKTGSGETDMDMREEMQKDVVTLIKEQLELMKIVEEESLQRKEAVIRNLKNSTQSFRREAERCNAGVLTCEEAREKAEAEFILEKKRTVEWEKRALESGWRDSRNIYT